MAHFWLRAEPRPNERRAPLTPQGAAALIAEGHQITVEESAARIFPDQDYAANGCAMARENTWPEAPRDAIILGLKELPASDAPLVHRHIMFGHAYKGQSEGARLLKRFSDGGGTLLDLEYLTDPQGRRCAAFGYWAGYVGAAISVQAWAATSAGREPPPLRVYENADALQQTCRTALEKQPLRAIIIGALGRAGCGATALIQSIGAEATLWDKAETAGGGPFPEILDHDIFLNCILAMPGVPVFVDNAMLERPRRLRVIGDISCDPDSDFSPVPIYTHATGWEAPCLRVREDPPLDVMAIDNLPSALPREASEEFAGQLLRLLRDFNQDTGGVWARAAATYQEHRPKV